jgi:acyl carrier protein
VAIVKKSSIYRCIQLISERNTECKTIVNKEKKKMAENIEKDIILIISDISGVDEGEITLDSALVKDLEIDSIKAIEIAVAVEKKFKVSIRDEDIPKITTPGQIISLTKTLLSQKRSN